MKITITVSTQTMVKASEKVGQILQTLCSFPTISTHEYIYLGKCTIITEWNKEACQRENRGLMLSDKGIPSTFNPEKDIDKFSLNCHI